MKINNQSITEYLMFTGHLSIHEHGAHVLLMYYHAWTKKPLPKGKELYRLLRAKTKADCAAIDKVLTMFWVELAEGYVCLADYIEAN